ncbi:phage terminase family protein [Streptomyces filamentosus]|uniref:phage terminase family protein n=1 Tax=Streptomyces filamentosus TaxID=67294 RepID=UPI001E4C7728|nr:phage terminase family protein [Streptomyces filamentosus]
MAEQPVEEVPDEITPVVIGPTWTRGEDGMFVRPAFTLGWHVLVWTGAYLQHRGSEWRYTNEQVRLILWWFALDPVTGEFAYRDAVLQRLKGWGKDPFGATLCAVEFVGPSRWSGRIAGPGDESGVPEGQPIGEPHPEPWVQVAAVSKDQTRNTMIIFGSLFTPKARAEYGIDIGKEVVYAHKGLARIEAVTSSPRALEGGRTTFTLLNETHHWIESNQGHEMAATIERNATKSADGSARTFAITNAFEPGEDSVAEQTRDAYEAAEAGRAEDTGILYDSLEAPPEAKLTKPWLAKVLEAVRGDSDWLNIPRLIKSILDPRNPPSRSRRFWYNQIVAAEDAWMARYEWDACKRDDLQLADGDEVVLFFDGSKSDDATGLCACRVSDGFVTALGVWQKPPNWPAPNTPGFVPYRVPREDVHGVVENTFARFKVSAFFADPGSGQDDDGEMYWDTYIDLWGQKWGAKLALRSVSSGAKAHAVRWDMRDLRNQETFTEAVKRTHADVLERTLAHDGHKVLRTHVINARRRTNRWGVTIGKEHRESARKIDLAVCMVGARMLRRMILNSPKRAKRRSPGKGRVVVLR